MTQHASWQASVERTVAGLNYDLVDVERAPRGLLRIYIDRLPGVAYDGDAGEFVTVEDCERVTRQLQQVLEVDGLEYTRLEVSSPGLDRPLKREADYARFVGQRIELTLKMPFQGRKKYEGELGTGGSPWRLALTVDEPKGKPGKARAPAEPQPRQALDFSFDEVREARLVPIVNFKGRPASGAAAHPASTLPDEVDGGQSQ